MGMRSQRGGTRDARALLRPSNICVFALMCVSACVCAIILYTALRRIPEAAFPQLTGPQDALLAAAVPRNVRGMAEDRTGDSPRFLVLATSSCVDIRPPKPWLTYSHADDVARAKAAGRAPPAPLYDVVLIDYSVNGNCSEFFAHRPPRVHAYSRPQTFKWPAVAQFFNSPAGLRALSTYDMFLLSDDDVDFVEPGGMTQPEAVVELLRTCTRARLHICQPALSAASAVNFAITRTARAPGRGVPDGSVRLTGFVEQMTPAFTREALMGMLPYMATLTHAWGVDALWSDTAERLGKRIGIVETVLIDHMRPSGISGLYKRIGGIEKARADQEAFRARYGIRDSIMALMKEDKAGFGKWLQV